MRARPQALLVSALVVGACGHEERRPAHDPLPPIAQNAPPRPPSAYAIADPEPNAVTLPLARGAFGLVVDRHRFLVSHGASRSAPDEARSAIVGASKVPNRLGGGFLFWTSNELYRADRFDGRLTPVVRVPMAIASVSFAPKSVFVHGHEGGRWAFALPGGQRVPITPLGATDVAALDDGRALAWNDQGFVFTSIDHGAHWNDVTVQMQSPPTRLIGAEGELWLVYANNGTARLDSDGRLTSDSMEPPPPAEFRPKDPRWYGQEPPLRATFRSGAGLDDSTALVMNAGNLVRVDLRTGALLSVAAGRLPPDADCQGLTVPGDVVFACMTPHGHAFVVSHTSSSEGPSVEQSFAVGGRFVAGDDGGLAYVGPCHAGAALVVDTKVVCVRTPSGTWEEHDVSRLAATANAPDLQVGHWVPRADGHVVALLVGTPSGIYDPSTQTVTPFDEAATDDFLREDLQTIHPLVWKGLRIRHPHAKLIDTSWTFGAGDVLRGWRAEGGSVELGPSGKLTRSSYTFEVAQAGALGLGRSKEGRLYQSTDHGVSWTEVDLPPAGVGSLETVRCSTAGCDLGAFYRVGWSARAPDPESSLPPATPPPSIRPVRGLELACKARGGSTSKVLARTGSSPDDLGLGAHRLPIANEQSDWAYLRNLVPRAIVNPLRSMASEPDESSSLRAIFSGFGTAETSDVIFVTGPNKSAMSLRRDVAFVVPFDPSARIARTSIAMHDVVVAGRRAGMTTEEILGADFTEGGAILPLTSVDATAFGDIAVHNSEHGLLTIVRGERARVVVRPSTSSAAIVSGAVLGGVDEAAFLEMDNDGTGRVFKVASSGVSDLFEVNSAANDTSYFPTNSDALAVGPKGELVILRTPSGTEPASTLDPAFVFSPGAAPIALAPWSQLALADDAGCKADPSGYRAVIQLAAPWIHVTSPDLRVSETAMLARVRWSPARVCLEGFEVRLPSVNVRASSTSGGSEPISLATWLVARGSTFARVGVADGIEWRQPLECSVAATP